MSAGRSCPELRCVISTLFHSTIICAVIVGTQQAAAKAGDAGMCPVLTPLNPPITGRSSATCVDDSAGACLDASFGNGIGAGGGKGGFVLTNTDGAVPKQNDLDGAVAVQKVELPNGSTRLVAVGATTSGVKQGIAVVRYNMDGSLDGTFGNAGIASTFFPSSALAIDGVADSNGDILVLASYDGGTVLRFTPAGALDMKFNGIGFYSTGSTFSPTAMALQSDGKILVLGSETAKRNSATNTAVIRLNTNGSPDSSFGSNGTMITKALSAAAAITSQSVHGLNYFLVGGSPPVGGFAIARFNPNGTTDSSFASGRGVATTDVCGFVSVLNKLAIDPFGNIVAAGMATLAATGTYKATLARFSADGVLDASFGSAGFTLLDLFGWNNYADAIAFTPDLSGNVLVAGQSLKQSGSIVNRYYFLAKYNSSGSLVSSFGSKGGIALDWGSANNYSPNSYQLGHNGILIEPADYRIVVATGSGFAGGPYAGYNFALARLWP